MGNLIRQRQHVVKRIPRPARSAKGDAFSELAICVLQAAGHLTQAGDALSGPSGLTSARWQVLAAAARAPSTVAQVARLLGVARQGVQRLADLLVAEKLVRFDDNPAHRKAKLLTLTPVGAKKLAEVRDRQAAWADRMGDQFSEADLWQANQILQQVLAALRAHPVSDA